jgi:hypothetical protein
MQLTDDFMAGWERIVNDVDKEHCPIACVAKVIFRTASKSQKTINLRNLRKQGLDEDSINQVVETYIQSNEDDIVSMEFVLDVKAVAELIQPETDKLLKGI